MIIRIQKFREYLQSKNSQIGKVNSLVGATEKENDEKVPPAKQEPITMCISALVPAERYKSSQ